MCSFDRLCLQNHSLLWSLFLLEHSLFLIEKFFIHDYCIYIIIHPLHLQNETFSPMCLYWLLLYCCDTISWSEATQGSKFGFRLPRAGLDLTMLGMEQQQQGWWPEQGVRNSQLKWTHEAERKPESGARLMTTKAHPKWHTFLQRGSTA